MMVDSDCTFLFYLFTLSWAPPKRCQEPNSSLLCADATETGAISIASNPLLRRLGKPLATLFWSRRPPQTRPQPPLITAEAAAGYPQLPADWHTKATIR
jgi:hypothetical protein